MSRVLTFLLTSWLTFLLLTTVAHAQSSTATLSGTVEDQNGAILPGVTITATELAKGLKRTVTSNDSGSFTIPLLPPGEYTVLVEREGFTRVQLTNIILNVGDQKAVSVQLKVGDVKSEVTVTADASLVRTDGSVGTIVDRTFVENLPLNGRSFQSLIALTPGVVTATVPNQFVPGQFSVNGQRTDTNYFTVDGVSANFGTNTNPTNTQGFAGAHPALAASGGTNNLVSVDALQEFKIQTNSYAPEFGRSPGAQVQIATRSGTNQFHATFFDYVRNDIFDAADWFVNANRLTKPPLRQNDFGFVIGGPIVLPKLYRGRDRTFFFVSYEGLRLRQPRAVSTFVPSLRARAEAAAIIKPFLDVFPLPNGPDVVNSLGQPSMLARLFASYSDSITLDAASVRIDHTVNNRLSFFGRYNNSPSSAAIRNPSASSIAFNNSDTVTFTVGSTMILSPAVSNDLRVNYSRGTGTQTNSFDAYGGGTDLPDSLLFPAFASPDDSIGRLLFTNPGETGANALHVRGAFSNNVQRQTNIVNSLSVVKGSHQLKFGIDYRRLFPELAPLKYRRNLDFRNFADVRLGRVSSTFITANEIMEPVYKNLSLFGQDVWKINRRLTLTYGLRWELNPPPSESNGKEALTVTGLADPATYAVAPRGTRLYNTSYTSFAPRIGLAYQISQAPGRETVLRGGFGIFYDIGSNSIGLAYATFPFNVSVTRANLMFPLTEEQSLPPPFPTNLVPPFPGSFRVYEPDFKLPYTVNFNVAIERSLGSSQSLTATYVAALGRRLLRADSRPRPNRNFTGSVIIYRGDTASDYHAMQLQFNRRLSKGLQAIGSYTWSHAIDEASDNFFTFTAERGNADFDVRHVFSAAVTYDIPAPVEPRIARAILRNWSVDSIVRWQSAPPVELVARANFTLEGVLQNVRYDFVGGVPFYIDDSRAPGGRRINPAALAIPPAGRQGTLGRNVLRAFPASQVDLAIRRRFSITERIGLQLRAEAFNVFNHPNFGPPAGGALTDPFFGRATSTQAASLGGLNPVYQIGGPRSLQFAVKLNF